MLNGNNDVSLRSRRQEISGRKKKRARARNTHGGVSLARARSFFAPIYFLAPATQATMTSTKIRLLYFKAQQGLKQICIVKQQPKKCTKITRTGRIFLQIHMFRSIDRSLRPAGRMPAMNYFVPLEIFVRQGRRTQSYQNHWRSIASVHCYDYQIFSILSVQKRGQPPPNPRHLCAEPVQYIKKIKITNKRTTHYAIKILITIFCYGKGIEGKMCLQHSTLLVQWRQRYKIHKFLYRTLRIASKASKGLTCLIFAFPCGGMPTKAFKKPCG